MTEADWISCTDPQEMLSCLASSPQASIRRLMLFVCACGRLSWWDKLSNGHGQRQVEATEQYVDGQVEARVLMNVIGLPPFYESTFVLFWRNQDYSLDVARDTVRLAAPEDQKKTADLIRCLWGPPFSWSLPRLNCFLLGCNGGTIKPLAEEVYDKRIVPAGTLDPQRLGILADALEEAGADAELVGHLREPGPHYRGCWPIDLICGKE